MFVSLKNYFFLPTDFTLPFRFTGVAMSTEPSNQILFEKSFDKNLLLEILETSQTPLFVKNREYRIILVNSALENLVGLKRDDILGKNDFDLYSPEEAAGFIEADEKVFQSRQPIQYEEVITDSDNVTKTLRTSKNVIETSTGELLLVGTVHDITELRAAQTKLEDAVNHLSMVAHTDSLTGLPNRLQFESELAGMIRDAGEEDVFSVAFIDLNGFKLINDTAGHLAGDEILRVSSKRLLSQLRGNSKVARIGGDEFLLLLPNTDADSATLVANRIMESFRKPIKFNGSDWNASCSIGISLYPHDGTTSAELIRNADLAMYEAKKYKHSHGTNPGSSVKFFCPKLGDAMERRRTIEWALNYSESGSGIEQYYQPIVALSATGYQIRGFESLARWNLNGKSISPLEFIPILDKSGGIVPFGYKVIESACDFLTGLDKSQSVSVNLTYKQILDKGFCDTVAATIRNAGVNPARLAFELTEQNAVVKKDVAAAVFDKLKRMGVKIMIDDFGSGYSNLGTICDLPIDIVKIDRSLTDNLRLLKSVLGFVRELGFDTVVEGIETEEIANSAVSFGANMLQGYYFGRPQPASFDWGSCFPKAASPIVFPVVNQQSSDTVINK